MRLSLVVAIAANGVIGDRGQLPWRISDDLKWFKKVTFGKPVIMGRKTFESIGKPLPGRRNIVVTRSTEWVHDGVIRAGDVSEAIDLATKHAKTDGADEICVIGGAEIYRQTLARADRIYLTRVDVEATGDTYFPEYDARAWIKTPAGTCERGGRNEYSCRFFILDRQ